MARLTLSFLGGWQACLDGRPLTGFESAKVRALLAYLAVETGRPHSRAEVADRLWPALPEVAALANLRQALANLRKTIGDTAAEPPYLLATRDTLTLNAAGDCAVDVAEFTRLLAACDAHRHRRAETCRACAIRLQAVADLYQGDFLAGFFAGVSPTFEEWALLWRERLRRQALDAFARLAAYYARCGAWTLAQFASVREIELDSWREEAHRRLMRALACSGQRTAALAQFDACRRILADDLAVTPTAETVGLYEQIKAGTLEKRATASPSLLNWPHPATPLIGRDAELADLAERLADPDCRLLTILGPGGMGKTRLALEAAAEQACSFEHGAAFVSLAALSSAEYLAPTIAHALGVALSGLADPRTQLIHALRDREILILLDNFEHLRDGLAFVSEILARAPGMQLVVTSRERLDLQGEWVFELRGLQCPDLDSFGPSAETFSAVQLFLHSARRVHSTMVLSPADGLAIGRICRLVGGMPLALELAAAWVRVISCAEIAAEIERGLGILSTTRPDVVERHRSLRAVFDHSWELLTADRQRALRNLSVFRGGFEREAAEQVAGATLPLLLALVDKSLVRWDHAGRYDLHELVAQYAGEKLRESGDEDAARDRHAAYFLWLAESAEPELRGPQQSRWLDRLEAERNNLRAALEWAVSSDSPRRLESGLRLAGALSGFWWMRGLSEGRDWLVALLQHPAAKPTAARAKALALAGDLAVEQAGSHAAARLWYEESLWISRALGDCQGCATALLGLGTIARAGGDGAGARSLYKESLALWRALDADWGIAWALHCLGQLAFNQGNLELARSLFDECLSIRKKLGDQSGVAWVFNALGEVARYQGDCERSRALYEESLRLHRELGNQGGVTAALSNLGYVALKQGGYVLAKALFEDSLSQHIGNQGLNALCVIGLAGVLRPPERAARLLGAAEPFRDRSGSLADRADYDRIVAIVRAQLDDTTFAAAWEAGRSTTLDQAVELALKDEWAQS